MEQIIYYVPRISTKHGEDIGGVFESLDDAVATVANFCRIWWEDARTATEDAPPVPDNDDEVIQTYFDIVEDEFYEIHQAPFYPKVA